MAEDRPISVIPVEFVDGVIAHYKDRLKGLYQSKPNKCDEGSYEGMILAVSISLEKWEKFRDERVDDQNSARKREIVDYLLGRGYDIQIGPYTDPHQPEIVKVFSFKQVRVKINVPGFTILLDPDAGIMITNRGMYITPNAATRRYSMTHIGFKKLVDNFEHAASSMDGYLEHIARANREIGLI